jgi:general secretion pathway protein F
VALPQTLERQGLAGRSDLALLRAAHETGNLDRVCQLLAARYSRAAERWRRLKGKLLLPAAVLVIAILVLPVPSLAGGSLSAGGYIVQVISMLGLLAVLAWTVSSLVRRWRAEGSPGWLIRAARLLPGVGPMSRLHQRAEACERFSLALASGMPAVEALAALEGDEANPVYRSALATAHAALLGGIGVAGALDGAGLLDSSGHALVSTGEAAGRLEDALDRVARQLNQRLDDAYDLLAQWIPVAFYLLVVAVVGAGLIA